MSLSNKDRLSAIAHEALQNKGFHTDLSSEAARQLRSISDEFSQFNEYDIFLSHSYSDAEIIFGLYLVLTDMGYSVYVDWIEDADTDRENVTPKTAELLRGRLKRCASLIYATSESAKHSRWMPWELGFFDGFKGAVAVFPVTKISQEESYREQEFVGLYPYVTVVEELGKRKLMVRGNTLRLFEDWIERPTQL